MTQETTQLPGARKGCYSLLASVLVEPPSAELIATLGSQETLALLDAIFEPKTVSLLRQAAEQAADAAEEAEVSCQAIQQDYQDLFNVPGKKYLAPYEAVFRDERDVGEKRVKGLLFGPSTDDVIRFYHVAGMEVSPEFLELPDHIGLEFHFMAYLCEQELKALADSDMELCGRIRETQCGFLDRHLSLWIDDFSAKMEENASTAFYQGIGRLAREFVTKDLAGLTDASADAVD